MAVEITTVRMPGRTCPVCGNYNDARSGRNEEPPKPGDVTICVCCGNLSEFQSDLSLRSIAVEDAKTDEAGKADIRRLQARFRAAQVPVKRAPDA